MQSTPKLAGKLWNRFYSSFLTSKAKVAASSPIIATCVRSQLLQRGRKKKQQSKKPPNQENIENRISITNMLFPLLVPSHTYSLAHTPTHVQTDRPTNTHPHNRHRAGAFPNNAETAENHTLPLCIAPARKV